MFVKRTVLELMDASQVLFEQRVNLMNLPVILTQLTRMLVPVSVTNRQKTVVVLIGLFMQFLVIFTVAYRAFGSLVIAGVRVFYLKFHHVLVRVGVNRFVTCAKWLAFSWCFILASGQIIEVFLFGNPSSLVFYSFYTDFSCELKEFKAIFDHIITTCSLISNLLELSFLIVIIIELAKLSRGAASLFSSTNRNVARKRVHKNVITGVGHFISWLTEILIFIMIQVIVMASKELKGQIHWDWLFLMLWPSINYVIFPIVQILTSKELREHVFGWMRPRSNCRRGKSGNEGGGVELVEMNVINRNGV